MENVSIDSKKTSHISVKQKELLVNFLEKHPEMYSGKFTDTYTKNVSLRLWTEITNILNSVPGAPAKEWRQWRKVHNQLIYYLFLLLVKKKKKGVLDIFQTRFYIFVDMDRFKKKYKSQTQVK